MSYLLLHRAGSTVNTSKWFSTETSYLVTIFNEFYLYSISLHQHLLQVVYLVRHNQMISFEQQLDNSGEECSLLTGSDLWQNQAEGGGVKNCRSFRVRGTRREKRGSIEIFCF